MRKIPLMFWPIIILVVWSILQGLVSFYPTLLWFDNVGFTPVLLTNIGAQLLAGLAFGLLFLLIAGLNIFVVRRLTKGQAQTVRSDGPANVENFLRELFGDRSGYEKEPTINITPRSFDIGRIVWLVVAVFSFFMGLSAVSQWEVVLKFFHASSFGIADPIFNQDVGFYIFHFPLQKFAQGFIFSSFLLSLGASIWLYLISGSFSFSGFKLTFSRGVKAHLAAGLAILAVVFAWGLWLGSLDILYSARGVVFGAGYTDVKAQLLGYNLQIMVLLVLAGIFLVNIFQKDYRLPIAGLGAYFVVALVMGGVYPAFIQNFQVKPNEISMEAPYIKNSIKFTRQAYGLNNVVAKEFAADDNLTLNDLRNNNRTVSNIRLWDPRPIIKTYRQLQGIRLYYDFSDVDIDRYTINGRYQQVMLSPREMRVEKLADQAQTWINQHLKFTHGYGLCMSPVNEQTPDGLPDLIVKDIPPTTATDLKISRPEIYFGEETDQYIIIRTKEDEFDYPKGDANEYVNYQGIGGIKIDGFFKKLAFAIKYADLKILLTDYITRDSRIMFDRNIKQRVAKIAPFLSYDSDPYLVVSKEGKMFWILDAYTISDLYPYSDPSGSGYSRFNYIRNSIKVVVDAYNGSVDFYLVDETDPLAQTYKSIYPSLFKPFASMPQDLKAHLRYPYDLFMVQARKYAGFHMEDPEVFYNQEDLWNVPKEIYGSAEQAMEAYYTIMRLPGEKKEEFLLMLPFTPNSKDNMIAWLAARSDLPNYGKLIVYKFPKDKLVYGPMQIEARIDQQTEISEQFTLWGQAGSRVIRGNLLAIPIEESILYVEPIFLEASSSELPELKRVIAAYGKNVAMGETLNQALSAVFSGRATSRSVIKQLSLPKDITSKELAQKALQKLDELKKVLQDLAR